MSMLNDIQTTLSQELICNKLTLEERAFLLCEITESLEWDTYDLGHDADGNYLGKDIKGAMNALNNLKYKEETK